jgi:hypothetical protein
VSEPSAPEGEAVAVDLEKRSMYSWEFRKDSRARETDSTDR